jgi:uncharacterized membrane protein YkoI
MKLNRFTALAVIALLAIGAMGLVSTRSAARTQSSANQQAQTTSFPPAQASGPEDPSSGPDTDTVEEQAGEQIEDGRPDGAEGAEDAGPDQQTPGYTGSVSVDATATEGMSEADESAALAGQAKITIEEAKTAALDANPGATIAKAELDNENGILVYSVELDNGTEIRVDAGNGVILHTEVGGDDED